MSKRKKKSDKSQNAPDDQREPQKRPAQQIEEERRQRFEPVLKERRLKSPGVKICQKCGGVLWPCGKCGDCGPWNNKGGITP